MSEAKKQKREKKGSQSSTNLDKSTISRIKDTHTSELVIGICSQIGAKKKLVIKQLKEELKQYDYKFEELKLSKFVSGDESVECEKQSGEKTKGFYNYIHMIEKGNALRETYGRDYLANIAVSMIAEKKKNKFNIEGEEDFGKVTSQRICYIIDSIKNVEELNVLRDIYNDVFYLISVFTPKQERIDNISIPHLTKNEAIEIIDMDEYEDSNDNGQQVRDVFVDADFFIKVDKENENEVKKKSERFINLIFEDHLLTPTIEERAMFEAKSASVNSACLSRQVGASILSEDNDLLAVGWNDVPKYGGNLYTSDSIVDNRCFFKGGYCYNDKNKNNIRAVIEGDFNEKFDKINFELKEKFIKSGFKFNKDFKEEDFNFSEKLDKINKELNDKFIKAGFEFNKSFKEEDFDFNKKISNLLKEVLQNSHIKNLIEFSRSVHAEMHAILNAGQLNGLKIKGGTLFCTTYPCHNCVRHIIAAGITKLYYIEPYIKSKGIDLHFDSITDDSILKDNDKKEKVQILMFEGVSPRKYLSFFNMSRSRKVKDIGTSKCNNREKNELEPINSLSLQALLYREIQASLRIKEKKQHIDEIRQQ